MARPPVPTWFYALVVVRRGDQFLAIREASHEQGWYLPAGRVEQGERLVDAARREALEETGVPVLLEGVIRFEHGLMPGGGSRVRVIFLARPERDIAPKHEPDTDSLEARWVTVEDLDKLPLRHPEVLELFRYVARGGAIFPLHVLADEGSPLKSG